MERSIIYSSIAFHLELYSAKSQIGSIWKSFHNLDEVKTKCQEPLNDVLSWLAQRLSNRQATITWIEVVH